MNKKRRTVIPVLLAVIIALCASTVGAFAAGNPNVTIISPGQGAKIEGNSFLVSVKIVKASRLKVEIYTERGGKLVLHEPVVYKNTGNKLTYYTKRVQRVTPGDYCIIVSTLGAKNRAVYKDKTVFTVTNKAEIVNFNSRGGNSGILQNLLRTIL